MALYANNYNGKVFQEGNKLKDYVVYEDSALITCILKLYTSQTLQDAIWQGTAEFQKVGDSVLVNLSDIRLTKVSSMIIGNASTDSNNTLELLDLKKNTSLLRKLKERIDYFLSLF